MWTLLIDAEGSPELVLLKLVVSTLVICSCCLNRPTWDIHVHASKGSVGHDYCINPPINSQSFLEPKCRLHADEHYPSILVTDRPSWYVRLERFPLESHNKSILMLKVALNYFLTVAFYHVVLGKQIEQKATGIQPTVSWPAHSRAYSSFGSYCAVSSAFWHTCKLTRFSPFYNTSVRSFTFYFVLFISIVQWILGNGYELILV